MQFGLLLQHVEGGDAGGRDGRRMRSGEQKRPGAMVEKIDEVARAADVAAERADGLGERAYLDVHAAVHLEVVDSAAAVAAEHAGGMRVIDHHDGAVFFGERAQPGQRADVAIHGKNAVGDEQLVAGLIFHAGQLLFGVRHILVAEDQDLGARKAAPSMMLA